MSAFAWVTLATNDSYSLGALVLAHSLRRANTAHQMAILITPGVSEAMRTQLSAVYNIVQVVDVLDSRDETNLTLLARPELGITFTKLHCWRLTQFSKCVFLDADTLVLQNCDELFEREELSAAPDAGWPDCFNSGVFVFQPSNDTFKKLMEFAVIHGSFDGGDQGLLNLYYKDWSTKDISKHLPFVYNMCSTATYSYLPAFKQFGENLKIIHFIGSAKPWLQVLDTETGLARVSGESYSIGSFIQLWWDLFCTHVHTSLSTEMGGLAGALATLTLGSPLSPEQTALQEHLRRQGWEQGNIDYMGRDSFDNIWRKISETLNVAESEENVLKAEELPPVSELPDSSAQPLIPIVCELPPKSLSSVEPKLQTPPATPPVPSPVILPAASAPAISSPSTPTPPPVSDSPSSPVSTPTTPTVAAPPSPPVTAPPTPSVAPVTASATTPVDPPVNILSTPISSPTLPSLPPVASQYAPEPPKSKPAPLLPASKPERSLTKITSPPQSPISPPPQKPSQPSPLTPPSSPKTEMPISKSIQPSTPTVTSPTPPTSPPVDPFDPTLSTKLKVDPETPGTPPAGAQPSTPTGSTDEPPVPPKRKGAKSVQEQQASKPQPKGGKPGKGKK